MITYLLSSSADYDVFPGQSSRNRDPGTSPCSDRCTTCPSYPTSWDVFRRPEDLPAVAAEAIEAGARTFWAQLGLHSDEAVALAHDAGLDAVTDRCLKIEHARFHGGLHLAGFNTGVISSRRLGS